MASSVAHPHTSVWLIDIMPNRLNFVIPACLVGVLLDQTDHRILYPFRRWLQCFPSSLWVANLEESSSRRLCKRDRDRPDTHSPGTERTRRSFPVLIRISAWSCFRFPTVLFSGETPPFSKTIFLPNVSVAISLIRHCLRVHADEYVVFVTPTALQLSMFSKILQPDRLIDLAQSSTAESLALINILTKISNSPILLKAAADEAKIKRSDDASYIQRTGVDEALGLLPDTTHFGDFSLSGITFSSQLHSWSIPTFYELGKLIALAKLLSIIRHVWPLPFRVHDFNEGSDHWRKMRSGFSLYIDAEHTRGLLSDKGLFLLPIRWVGNFRSRHDLHDHPSYADTGKLRKPRDKNTLTLSITCLKEVAVSYCQSLLERLRPFSSSHISTQLESWLVSFFSLRTVSQLINMRRRGWNQSHRYAPKGTPLQRKLSATLKGASRLCLIDSDWNPRYVGQRTNLTATLISDSHDLQSMARCHRWIGFEVEFWHLAYQSTYRDGQRRPVFIYRFLTTGAIDGKRRIYRNNQYWAWLEWRIEKVYQRQVTKLGLSACKIIPPLADIRPF